MKHHFKHHSIMGWIAYNGDRPLYASELTDLVIRIYRWLSLRQL